MQSRTTFLWKLCCGFVIAVTSFIGPLADALPYLPSTPVAYAADYPGVENTPAPEPCGSSVTANPAMPTCTDYGQSQALIGKLKRRIDYQLTFAAYLGVLNAATYFAQSVAYDTAEWASNGFKGKAPGIFTDPFGTYTQNLLLDSLGEFMGTFSENFTQGVLGFDLCRPPNFPQLALEFALGLPGLSLNAVQRPRPKCSWTDITHNWEQSAQSLNNAESLRNIKANFSTGGNDVSFGVGAHLAFFDAVAEKRYAGIQERLLGRGYKDVTNFLSGNIETPAQTVQRSIENQIIENPAMAQNTNQGALLSNAFELGWVQLGVVTASTFTNVLLSRLLQKVAKGLFKTTTKGSRPDFANPNAAPSNSTRPEEIFASQYSDLKTPRIVRSEAQDLLTELVGCPTDVRNKWNCAMDESLATALRQGGGLTVRQAIDQGFINPNWQLIPSTRLKDNQDPTCRSRAFCTSNLRKLRLARVLPIGWELAADSPANQQGCTQSKGCVTLAEVISRFDDCSTNPFAPLDADHPYCHLIDPNWVLTAFPAQCQTQGYSNTLLGGTSQRAEECQDTALCLQRDKDGACIGGYGYCMAEQTFWQFDAPVCQEQYVSCRTYQPRGSGAKPISFLRSTLDYGSCDETNVGCMWYARERDPAGADANTAWDAGVRPADGTRVYFDKNVAVCAAADDGCTDLRRTVQTQPGVNLVQNGSFESSTTTAGTDGRIGTVDDGNGPVGWSVDPVSASANTSPNVGSGAPAVDGAHALLLTGTNSLVQEPLALRPLRQYTLSFYARQNAGAPSGVRVALRVLKADGSRVGAAPSGTTYYRSIGCTYSPSAAERHELVGVTIPALTDEWVRYSCSFVTTPDTGSGRIRIQGGTNNPLFDGVQLEESEVPTPFSEGLNTTLETVTMRIPPEELKCTGNTETDHALCANFAAVCRQNEAGCQGYRPVGQSGAPEVPAVVKANDLCPAECVGYAEFRKQASTFDLVRNVDTRLDDPRDDTVATFVPSTAFSCAAQDVGCELFTNLDAGTLGGESEVAFSYLRACEKPSFETQTYYTWEGSDTSGFQLKTWSLKRDATAPLPQGPKVVVKVGPDGFLKDPLSCNQNTYLQALDSDCRQFYDPQGNVFYRFESQTVLSSDQCKQLRKEGSNEADCSKTGGAFNTATNQCIYLAVESASNSCDAAFAGCRAYIGTQGRAQEEIYNEDFSSTDFKAKAEVSTTELSQSDESVLVGDQSLRVAATTDLGVRFGSMPLESGVLYELTFWAKAQPRTSTSQLTATVTTGAFTGGTQEAAGSVTLTPEWKTYRVGPFSSSRNLAEGAVTISVANTSLVFFDKVRVERVQDLTYAVKNSWNTPASCDRSPEGIPEPQAMLGCRTYEDRRGTQVNIRQFTSLCRETAIGCTAYVNTKNSDTSYGQTWQKPGTAVNTVELTTAPADQYDYFIEDRGKFCKPKDVGCRAFGKPNYAQDRLSLKTDEPFSTVYFIDDVRKYDDALCSEKELFCESYTYTANDESGTSYFRAPADHACEYRSAVVVPDGTIPGVTTGGRTYDGWFRIGTDTPCYPERLLTGSLFGLRLTGDFGFNPWNGAVATNYWPDGNAPQGVRAWAATCPVEAAECTELRDVNDQSDPLHPLGRPYHVIKNSQFEECDQVDPGRGCVLFRDMSDTRLNAGSRPTAEFYKQRSYQPVSPVNCEISPDHPACQTKACAAAQGTCTNDVQCGWLIGLCFQLGAFSGDDCKYAVQLGCSQGDQALCGLVPLYENALKLIHQFDRIECTADSQCSVTGPLDSGNTLSLTGSCTRPRPNDTNIIVKVKPDRACSEWMSCQSAETVYDAQTGQYRSICSDLALCNRQGATEGDEVPFCANYLDRSLLSTETILKENIVTTAALYAGRQTGFGAKDYSGATIPDQFQVMDTKLVPIASMLTVDPRVRSAFKKDYRLAVAVPTFEGTSLHGLFAKLVDADSELLLAGTPDELKPFACQITQTGAFGLLTDVNGVLDEDGDGLLDGHPDTNGDGVNETTDGDGRVGEAALCWTSVDQGKPPQLGSAGAPLVSDNLNALNLAVRFGQVSQPMLDNVLSRSFPNTQCKAAPEPDAPFGNEFIIEWDDTVDPPQPKRVAAGYGQTNLCEYGEACSCTYKRVEYGGLPKFYEPLSTNVVNAVCNGGPRDGEPCVLNVGIKGSQPTGAVQPTDAEGNPITDDDGNAVSVNLEDVITSENANFENPLTSCGDGGTCRPITKVSLVRGVVGQCLQPDISRVIAGDQSRNECLLWNPNAVFAGPGDQYHWIPTAGFQPPQSSGRYYCTSPYREPKTIQFRPRATIVIPSFGEDPVVIGDKIGFALNSADKYAGQISRFWYSDDIASDKSCLNIPNPFGDSCDGNQSGGSLDGSTSEGTRMGEWCESADDDQSPSSDFNAVRLITTGRSQNQSYAEYAVMLDWESIGRNIAGLPATGEVDMEAVIANSLEDSIASFSFSTDYNKLGCAYSEDWVEGVHAKDYDDKDSWKPQDKEWQAGFKAEITRNGGVLDRRKAQIVTEDGTMTGTPVKVRCNIEGNKRTDDDECYMKVWTFDYRAEGQTKFQAFGPDIGRPSLDTLSKTPVYGKCPSDHSWFSIRAVFENTNAGENDKDPDAIRPESMVGPFQIAGFWVTACSPHSGPRYIYTYVSMSTADVCRELAETISKDSHDAVAFTDRNSTRSGFTMPRNGFTWGTTNIPFGASLATGDAGAEPLYMTGVKQSASNPLNPPTFTFPGQTYFTGGQYPRSNWGLLSNVFAKIYRIYGYNSRGVSRGDWACTDEESPNFGQWCPDLSNISDDNQKKVISQKFCGLEAKCVATGFSGGDFLSQKVCNTFSGVNRGLDCSADPDICHKGPMQQTPEGFLAPAYGECKVHSVSGERWSELSSGAWRCEGNSCPDHDIAGGNSCSSCSASAADTGCPRNVAIACGAFRCADGTARQLDRVNPDPQFALNFCSRPKENSSECPVLIAAGSEACVDIKDGFGVCESHRWAQCKEDDDCVFSARQFWPSGVANQFFNWANVLGKIGNWTRPFPSYLHGEEFEDLRSELYRYGVPSSMTGAGADALKADDGTLLRTAFSPAYSTADESKFFALPINTEDFVGGGIAGYFESAKDERLGTANTWNDTEWLELYPGFAPMILGGHPSGDWNIGLGKALTWVDLDTGEAPYGYFVYNGPDTKLSLCVPDPANGRSDSLAHFCTEKRTESDCGTLGYCLWQEFTIPGLDNVPSEDAIKQMVAHYAACEPRALMFQATEGNARGGSTIGICAGGARAGASCGKDQDCRPAGMSDSEFNSLQTDSKNWCNPVTNGDPEFTASAANGSGPGNQGNESCWLSAEAKDTSNRNHPKRQEDPALDTNICTHPPGYWPRPNWCKNPNDEYCGLFGYNLNDLNESVSDKAPLPTDVTPGLYTPAFLNPNGSNISRSPFIDYNYVSYYNPIPPQVAAPDMRTCTGGTCRTSQLGSIGIDGLNEGIVNGGSGSYVASLRFYAWAAHEQMPLRRVVIDWGDGSRTELPDAFLKNHKPYCQTDKECSLSPGLTCESDADCPPGGGTCQTYGTCASDPNRRCFTDSQCNIGGEENGICNPRTFFGNDGDACEEQYFEFRHSYACLPSSKPSASCSSSGACSSNPSATCSSASDCPIGDRCVQNMASVDGCFDQSANTCRFTPRIYLVDNWGWCTGECRDSRNPSGNLIDSSSSDVRHPNGGCFNSSNIKSNVDFETSITGVNECDTRNPSNNPPSGALNTMRPWIVFPGSIQLRTGEAR